MKKPTLGPLGLSLRDCILRSAIVASMALSACMTSREKEATVEQIKADARARLEQQEQQQEPQHEQQQEQEKSATLAAREAALKEWLTNWVKDNEPYIRGLCESDPGTDHQWTWDNFHVAVSTDTQHSSEAAKAGRPLIDCEQFRIQKPAAFNADAFMESLKAEHIKRDEWLASRTGKEYQQHLCSLSGDERQKALAAAAQLHGIIPRENVTDEQKARKHGFAVLNCAQEKTSEVGYTWSNVRAGI
jgi:hypothetical protein